MNIESFLTLRSTGIMLLASVLIPFGILLILSRGDLSGYQASIKGIEGVGHNARILKYSIPVSSFAFVLTVCAYGMLTILLQRAGDSGLAMLAFILILFSQVFMVLQGSFHGDVTVWASGKFADTGKVPELFQPLWVWMYHGIQSIFSNTWLLAGIIYGLAILKTGLLAPWLGWGLIIWSGAWLLVFLYFDDNLPLILFIASLVIGMTALLTRT